MVRTSRPYSCSPRCATADASPAIPAGGPYDSPNTAQPPCTTTWAWTPPTTTRGPTTQPDRPSPTCDDCASERRRTFRWPAPHRRDRRPARAAGRYAPGVEQSPRSGAAEPGAARSRAAPSTCPASCLLYTSDAADDLLCVDL